MAWITWSINVSCWLVDFQLLVTDLSAWPRQLLFGHLCLLDLSQCVFTVKLLCETSPPEIWATSSTAFRSGLLIINLNAEKVTAGPPGVTVAMTTLINILSPLICLSVGSAELLRRFTVTVLWHMWTEAGGWELLCHINLIPVVVKHPIILPLAGDSLCLSLYQKLE